jgi:hypothetical protein
VANYTWSVTAADLLRYTGGTGSPSAQMVADVAPHIQGAAGEVNAAVAQWAGVDPSAVGSSIEAALGDTNAEQIRDILGHLAAGRYLRPKNIVLAESLLADGRELLRGLRYRLPEARALLSVEVAQSPEPPPGPPRRSVFDSRDAFD